jgi:hypothetical protein
MSQAEEREQASGIANGRRFVPGQNSLTVLQDGTVNYSSDESPTL